MPRRATCTSTSGAARCAPGRCLDALLGRLPRSARASPGGASSAGGVAAGVDPATLYLLAESIFAYIDELSAKSAEGYALEQSAAAGERQRAPPAARAAAAARPAGRPADVEDAARAARLAAAARRSPRSSFAGAERERIVPRAAARTRSATRSTDVGLRAACRTPTRRGRRAAARRPPSAPRRSAALGPAVGLARRAALSLARARAVLELPAGARAGRRARRGRPPTALLLRSDRRARAGARARAARAARRAARPARARACRDARRLARRAGAPAGRRRAPPRPPADGPLPPRPPARAVRRRARRPATRASSWSWRCGPRGATSLAVDHRVERVGFDRFVGVRTAVDGAVRRAVPGASLSLPSWPNSLSTPGPPSTRSFASPPNSSSASVPPNSLSFPLFAPQRVVVPAAFDFVFAFFAVEPVVAGVAVDRVGAGLAEDGVVAVVAFDQVVAGAGGDVSLPGAPRTCWRPRCRTARPTSSCPRGSRCRRRPTCTAPPAQRFPCRLRRARRRRRRTTSKFRRVAGGSPIVALMPNSPTPGTSPSPDGAGEAGDVLTCSAAEDVARCTGSS